ncbi:MAG: hypothetical protein V1897_04050, partial [Pseudomonadota bacterium]
CDVPKTHMFGDFLMLTRDVVSKPGEFCLITPDSASSRLIVAYLSKREGEEVFVKVNDIEFPLSRLGKWRLYGHLASNADLGFVPSPENSTNKGKKK